MYKLYASASREIDDPKTFATAIVVHPFSLAKRKAAIVSAVSPD